MPVDQKAALEAARRILRDSDCNPTSQYDLDAIEVAAALEAAHEIMRKTTAVTFYPPTLGYYANLVAADYLRLAGENARLKLINSIPHQWASQLETQRQIISSLEAALAVAREALDEISRDAWNLPRGNAIARNAERALAALEGK